MQIIMNMPFSRDVIRWYQITRVEYVNPYEEYLYDNIRMYGNGHVNQQNRPPGFWQHKVVIWKQTRRERRLEILVFSP